MHSAGYGQQLFPVGQFGVLTRLVDVSAVDLRACAHVAVALLGPGPLFCA